MKNIIKLPFLNLLLMMGCTNEQMKLDLEKTKNELEKSKQELQICSSELTEILNTPEQRIFTAKKLVADERFTRAITTYEIIKNKFPNTEYSETASKEILVINNLIKKRKIEEKQKQEEEERKRALGFKILKPTNRVKFENLTINFEKTWIGKRWSFDDHGSRYSLRDATRGNKHILVRLSISAEDKNPKLPPILAYKYSDGTLSLIGTLGYEFRRWKDYGSYLGNNADYGNDFAHSKTIPFNLGLQTEEENIKKGGIFLVIRKVTCFTRENNDFGRPEIEYKMGNCAPKRTLTVSDFDDDYVLIKNL